MPKTGESATDRAARMRVKARDIGQDIRDTSPDSETKDQMKSREAQAVRPLVGDQGGYKRGGKVKMARGGGIESKGKTRGRFI